MNDDTGNDPTLNGPRAGLATGAKPRSGTTLSGKYLVEELLGAGAFASVHSATDRNGRRVAIKVVHPEFAARPDFRERFLRELYVANDVDHPGVVRVLDDDVAEDGCTFLVMDLLHGQTIEGLWERHGRRLPLKLVLAVGFHLCDVLVAAHDAGIAHRNLKPAKLFVTRAAQLKVLAFGGANLNDGGTPKSLDPAKGFGTASLMASEHASGGGTSKVDPSNDLWDVGATMFLLLSGREVPKGESTDRRRARIGVPSIATVTSEIDPRFAAFIDRAMAAEPGDRWQTAAEMRDAISAVSLALHGEVTPNLATDSATLLADAPMSSSGLVDTGADAARVVEHVKEEPEMSTDPTNDTSADRTDDTLYRPLVERPIAPPDVSDVSDVSDDTRVQPLGLPVPPPPPPPAVRPLAKRPRSAVALGLMAAGVASMLLVWFFVLAPSQAPASVSRDVPRPTVAGPIVTPIVTTEPPVNAPLPPVFAGSTPAGELTPTPTPTTVAPAARPRAAPRASPKAPRKPDCSQKFFMVDGRKVWRPECID